MSISKHKTVTVEPLHYGYPWDHMKCSHSPQFFSLQSDAQNVCLATTFTSKIECHSYTLVVCVLQKSNTKIRQSMAVLYYIQQWYIPLTEIVHVNLSLYADHLDISSRARSHS